MAAERTLLAWIRTGLALMGLGFVLARFGLFLRALQGNSSEAVTTHSASFWFGIGLLVLGAFINVVSGWSHFRLVRELDRGTSGLRRPAFLGVALAFLLAVIGLSMAVYVASVREPQPVLKEKPMNSGIVNVPSQHTVDETVASLQKMLEAKGIKLFAFIDHSGEAEKAGMHMRPTKLVIFGSPKAGTPLMIASPSSAIDLPLKLLIWEDADGKTWISHNSPEYLQERHRIPAELAQNIAVIKGLAETLASSQ